MYSSCILSFGHIPIQLRIHDLGQYVTNHFTCGPVAAALDMYDIAHITKELSTPCFFFSSGALELDDLTFN